MMSSWKGLEGFLCKKPPIMSSDECGQPGRLSSCHIVHVSPKDEALELRCPASLSRSCSEERSLVTGQECTALRYVFFVLPDGIATLLSFKKDSVFI